MTSKIFFVSSFLYLNFAEAAAALEEDELELEGGLRQQLKDDVLEASGKLFRPMAVKYSDPSKHKVSFFR